MKLRIISDGRPSGTKVLDELGNRIENVRSINWQIGIDQLSTAIIELRNMKFETSLPGEIKPNGIKANIRKRLIRCVKDEVVEVVEGIED